MSPQGTARQGTTRHGVARPYPVLIAEQLVARGYARAAFVRNLGEGALHGAAVPALCCEQFLAGESDHLGYTTPHAHRVWRVNASSTEPIDGVARRREAFQRRLERTRGLQVLERRVEPLVGQEPLVLWPRDRGRPLTLAPVSVRPKIGKYRKNQPY